MKISISILLVSFLMLFSMANLVSADDGLVSLRSQFDVQETLDRYEAAAQKGGLKVFIRIDHAKGAQKVGKALRPTQLLIFGSPKVGTGVMSSDQRAGLDLPLKALAWQDAEGVVWLSYTRPEYMFERFNINDRPALAQKMSGALAKFAKAATQP